MSVVAVIPARYASRRFPGKPLAPILGRPMIAWVVAAAQAARKVDQVLVATDDDRIAQAARDAGAEVRMTSAEHATGTDRVAEAVRDSAADVVLNLQGDEPLLSPPAVDALVEAFADLDVRMATLAVRGVTEADRQDPNVAKIVVDDRGDALYFSRAAIPFRNEAAGAPALGAGERDLAGWKHVGTYGFRRDALREFVAAPREGLEALEDLEQLRALRLGWRIRVVAIRDEPICVDRPEDVARVEVVLRNRSEGVAR
ncbi:MAG: 3-deoxy-manno-octulosonate cytidylyltransferase [Gemmatimonadota bacterium]|nr:MAG: 3-deoxy-manno-octulosonate cytidylyltransferase [Gemmatimonadota bacterium]